MGPSVPGASFEAWVVALVFVVALAVGGWALVRYVRRSQGPGAQLPQGVRVLGRIPMGMNHAVVLLEMVDHVLVVGVGDTLTLLDRIDDREGVKALMVATGPQSGPFALFRRERAGQEPADFRRILDDALGRIRRRSRLGGEGGEGKDDA